MALDTATIAVGLDLQINKFKQQVKEARLKAKDLTDKLADFSKKQATEANTASEAQLRLEDKVNKVRLDNARQRMRQAVKVRQRLQEESEHLTEAQIEDAQKVEQEVTSSWERITKELKGEWKDVSSAWNDTLQKKETKFKDFISDYEESWRTAAASQRDVVTRNTTHFKNELDERAKAVSSLVFRMGAMDRMQRSQFWGSAYSQGAAPDPKRYQGAAYGGTAGFQRLKEEAISRGYKGDKRKRADMAQFLHGEDRREYFGAVGTESDANYMRAARQAARDQQADAMRDWTWRAADRPALEDREFKLGQWEEEDRLAEQEFERLKQHKNYLAKEEAEDIQAEKEKNAKLEKIEKERRDREREENWKFLKQKEADDLEAALRVDERRLRMMHDRRVSEGEAIQEGARQRYEEEKQLREKVQQEREILAGWRREQEEAEESEIQDRARKRYEEEKRLREQVQQEREILENWRRKKDEEKEGREEKLRRSNEKREREMTAFVRSIDKQEEKRKDAQRKRQEAKQRAAERREIEGLRRIQRARSEAYSRVGAPAALAAGGAAVAGGFALAGLARGAVRGTQGAVETGMDFQAQMSTIQSVVNRGQADINEQMARIQKKAREMGRTTAFSAIQAAEGMTELARAGLTADEVIAAIEPSLRLAGASGYDLARTTSVVVAAMKQFGIEADRTQEIANVFAHATRASLLTMPALAEAMKYAGTVGAGFGLELEETVAGVAAFRDMGLEGSLAGTNFRMAMQAATKATSKKTEAMAKLGLSYDDVNPEQKTFLEMLEKAGEAGMGVKEGMLIFSTRAGANVAKLAKDAFKLKSLKEDLAKAQEAADQPAIKDLTDQIDEMRTKATDIKTLTEELKEQREAAKGTGAAFEMYEQQLDNVAGDIVKIKSAFADLQITLFGVVEGPLRAFMSGKGTAWEGSGIIGIINKVSDEFLMNAAKIEARLLTMRTKFFSALEKAADNSVDTYLSVMEAIVNMATLFVEVAASAGPLLQRISADAQRLISWVRRLSEAISGSDGLDDALVSFYEVAKQVLSTVLLVKYAKAVMSIGDSFLAVGKTLNPAFGTPMLAMLTGVQFALNQFFRNWEDEVRRAAKLAQDPTAKLADIDQQSLSRQERIRDEVERAMGTENMEAMKTLLQRAFPQATEEQMTSLIAVSARDVARKIAAQDIAPEDFSVELMKEMQQAAKAMYAKEGGISEDTVNIDNRVEMLADGLDVLALAVGKTAQVLMPKEWEGKFIDEATSGKYGQVMATGFLEAIGMVNKALPSIISGDTDLTVAEQAKGLSGSAKLGSAAAWTLKGDRTVEQMMVRYMLSGEEALKMTQEAYLATLNSEEQELYNKAVREATIYLNEATVSARKSAQKDVTERKGTEIKEQLRLDKEVVATEAAAMAAQRERNRQNEDGEAAAINAADAQEAYNEKLESTTEILADLFDILTERENLLKNTAFAAKVLFPDTMPGQRTMGLDGLPYQGFESMIASGQLTDAQVEKARAALAAAPGTSFGDRIGGAFLGEQIATSFGPLETAAIEFRDSVPDIIKQLEEQIASGELTEEGEKKAREYLQSIGNIAEAQINWARQVDDFQAKYKKSEEARLSLQEEAVRLTREAKSPADQLREDLAEWRRKFVEAGGSNAEQGVKDTFAIIEKHLLGEIAKAESEEAKESLIDKIKKKLKELYDRLPEWMKEVIEGFKTLAKVTSWFARQMKKGIGFVTSLMGIEGGLSGVARQAMEGGGPQIVLEAANALIEGFNRLAMDFQGIINTMLMKLPEVLGIFLTNLPVILGTLLQSSFQFIETLMEMLPTLIDGVVKFIPEIAAFLPKLVTMVMGMLPDILTSLLDASVVLIQELVRAIPLLVEGLLVALPDIITSLVQAIPEIIGALIEAIPQLIAALIRAIPEIIRLVIRLVPELVMMVIRLIPEIIRGFINGIPAIVQAFKDGIVDKLFNKEWWKSIGENLRGLWKDFVADLKDAFKPGRRDSYQSGTPFVPRTGLAYLHKGEAVIPAESNPWNSAAPKSAVGGAQNGGGETNISLAVNADGQLLDSILVRAGRKGKAPELFRAMRKASGVALGFDRGNFAPKSR